MDDWELVLEEFGSRSSLGEVLELLDTVSVAPDSPFWERENSVRDSGLSGNLVHELLPLPGPAVTLFLSTHLSSPQVPRRRTASSLKVWVCWPSCGTWLVSRGLHGRSCVASKRKHETSPGRSFLGVICSYSKRCPQPVRQQPSVAPIWPPMRGVEQNRQAWPATRPCGHCL